MSPKMIRSVHCLLACLAMVVLPLAAQTTGSNTVNSAFLGSNLEAYPPNISLRSGGAMMMLLASKDHTLFSPIYTDYEDLDGDGVLDNTFKPAFKYYGYFDSNKCYRYNGSTSNGHLPRFEPEVNTVSGTFRCPVAATHWSGNFLNWATMTRLDVVRKLLYGGFRREDTATDTTLEMAQLGQDAHSFVKYYGGSDIGDFTPFSDEALGSKGMTICNRSTDSDAKSGMPVMRVVKGNFSLWATIPSSVVCRFNGEGGFSFGQKARGFFERYGTDAEGNNILDVQAHAESLPSRDADGLTTLGDGPEYAVRVQVCATTLGTPTLASERCLQYGAGTQVTYKPVGLLQLYGATTQTSLPAKAEFGLMTGSYDSPIVGGVLRKNMGSLNDEIDLSTGRYCYGMRAADAPRNCKSGRTIVQGIVASFDRIRLFDAGAFNSQLANGREFVLPDALLNGDFPSWGNPMSEMYVQALSYLAGKSVGTSGPVGNTKRTSFDRDLELPAPAAFDPLNNTTIDTASGLTRSSLYGHGICRKSLALAISSSAVSYDTNDPSEPIYSEFQTDFVGSNKATAKTIAAWTDQIGIKSLENLNETPRSVGSANGSFGTDCTLKDLGVGSVNAGNVYVGGLSAVAGVCPEAPAVKGSYLGAGAAFFARTTAIRADSELTADTGAGIDKQTLPPEALRVKSYAASLSGGVARIEVPIPGTGRFVVITPESLWAHEALNGALMPGAMLTFRAIGKQPPNAAIGFGGSGSYVVTWNDAQFGGDYDMDMVGFIRWTLRKSTIAPGKWELSVQTDVLNHNAGAKGSHGFSIIGTDGGVTVNGDVFKGDGRHITHGSNGFDASEAGTDCAAGRGTLAFDLHCTFQDGGFPRDGANDFDNFAWPTTLNGQRVYFLSTSAPLSTTVSTKFMVSSGTDASTVALRDPLWYLAKYGGFETGEAVTTAWAARRSTTAVPSSTSGGGSNWDRQRNDGVVCTTSNCGDGEPDSYFLARRPDLLEQRLNEVFDRELNKSNTAVAVSSAELLDGSFKYVARFSESEKQRFGTVEASKLADSGEFVFAWDAGKLMASQSPDSRQIITNLPVNGVQTGVAFDANLVPAGVAEESSGKPAFLAAMAGSASNPVDTASKLIAYMRGDRAQEGLTFRSRGVDNIMGPVVSSTPWVQDPAAAGDFATATPSYAAFVATRALRNKLLWVGSHDGMLHGINARTGATMLSYVPSPVVSRLLPTFSVSTAQAVPLVDGAPFTADVLRGAGTSNAAWRTYLFGALGRGGKAVYALDVTNTGSIASAAADSSGDLLASNASNLFQWIFTASDDPDLGHLTTGPTVHRSSRQAHQVVRLNNGKFGLLVPNGVQSSDGRAVLFILFVDGPGKGAWTDSGSEQNYVKLTAQTSDANNGLVGVTWVDLNNDGTADAVYGTDLRGQVWKFNISSSSVGDWGSAFKALRPDTTAGGTNAQAVVNVPFFTAKACVGAGTARSCTSEVAVTTSPVATQPSFGGVLVSFGTGRALTAGDFPNSATTNRFFTVWDKGRYEEDQMLPPPNDSGFTRPLLPSVEQRFAQLQLRRDETTGLVFRVQYDDRGREVAIPVGGADLPFNPTSNDGWYFDFPSEGEQLISSPVGRRTFVSFTSVRPLSTQAASATCASDASGTFYAIDPATGGPIKGLFRTVVVNGVTTLVYGLPTSDQQTTAVQDRSTGGESGTDVNAGTGGNTGTSTGGQGTRRICGPGEIKVRPVGSGQDLEAGCIDAPNLRLQWREIPGMKTK